MCLAVPGRVVRWIDNDPIGGVAEVAFGSITSNCHMACVPTAKPDDYVIVHAGVAIAIIDQTEAQKILQDFAALPDDRDDTISDPVLDMREQASSESIQGGRE
jgi:hydrogenase expression/formation protein HypC